MITHTLIPKYELSGYTANFASVTDHFSLHKVKAQIGVGKDVGVFLEKEEGRISAPLAAGQTLSGKLGDTPYQTAFAALIPSMGSFEFAN